MPKTKTPAKTAPSTPKKHRGPTKRTPEAEQKVLDAIKVGAPWRYAAAVAGVNEDTLLVWRKTDPAFSERLARAKDEAAVELLKKIQDKVEGDWRAALALLRIHDREAFSERIAFRGDVDAPVQHNHVDQTDAISQRIRSNPELAAQFDRLIAEAGRATRVAARTGPGGGKTADPRST